ncbi:unnamed protein product, partial [Mesorhabditis spiculigera]
MRTRLALAATTLLGTVLVGSLAMSSIPRGAQLVYDWLNASYIFTGVALMWMLISALWSSLPPKYMWLTMQTTLEKFDTPMYRMLLNSGIGLDTAFTAWINAALVNKYRNIILCQGSPTQDAEVELPLEDVVARQPDFFFLHADEICGWSDTLGGNYVISLKKEFCIGRSAKPEYTNITECFKEGGKPLNERYTELAKNASCGDTEILYRDYIATAALSCPESAKTAKVAARGVMIELLVRMVLAANGADGKCYADSAQTSPITPTTGTLAPHDDVTIPFEAHFAFLTTEPLCSLNNTAATESLAILQNGLCDGKQLKIEFELITECFLYGERLFGDAMEEQLVQMPCRTAIQHYNVYINAVAGMCPYPEQARISAGHGLYIQAKYWTARRRGTELESCYQRLANDVAKLRMKSLSTLVLLLGVGFAQFSPPSASSYLDGTFPFWADKTLEIAVNLVCRDGGDAHPEAYAAAKQELCDGAALKTEYSQLSLCFEKNNLVAAALNPVKCRAAPYV